MSTAAQGGQRRHVERTHGGVTQRHREEEDTAECPAVEQGGGVWMQPRVGTGDTRDSPHQTTGSRSAQGHDHKTCVAPRNHWDSPREDAPRGRPTPARSAGRPRYQRYNRPGQAEYQGDASDDLQPLSYCRHAGASRHQNCQDGGRRCDMEGGRGERLGGCEARCRHPASRRWQCATIWPAVHRPRTRVARPVWPQSPAAPVQSTCPRRGYRRQSPASAQPVADSRTVHRTTVGQRGRARRRLKWSQRQPPPSTIKTAASERVPPSGRVARSRAFSPGSIRLPTGW